MVLDRFGLLDDCWRVLDARSLLGRSHLLSIQVDELRAVGDRPDAVRLDLLDEGIANEVQVLDLLLFERTDLGTSTARKGDHEPTSATKHATVAWQT